MKKLSMLFVVLFLSVVAGQNAMAGTVFSTAVNTTRTKGANDFNPSIVGDPTRSGTVYVVADDTPASTGNSDILFMKSADSGTRWDIPKNLSNDAGKSGFPQIVADASGNLYIVWDDDTGGNTDIYFTKSTDRGRTFSTTTNISNNSGGSGKARLTVDSSGNIYVVWQDATGLTQSDIFFTKSTDGGKTFSTPTDISNTPTSDSRRPFIGVDKSGVITVVWEDNYNNSRKTSLFSRSTDGGVTFSTPIDATPGANGSGSPATAVNGDGTVYIAYSDKGQSGTNKTQTMFTMTADGGQTFSTPINLSNDTGIATAPNIFVGSDGVIRVSWMDNSVGNYEAYYDESVDGGETFSNPQDVSNNYSGGLVTTIGTDKGGTVYEAWDDSTSGFFEILASVGKPGNVGNFIATPTTFSPNGDGVQDTTVLSASFTESSSWTLTLTNASSTVIRSFTGSGTSMSTTWDGTDSSSATVPDGAYTATLSGTTAANGAAFTSAATTVSVSRTPAPAIVSFRASPGAFSPNGDGYRDTTTLSASFTTPMAWTVAITDSASTTVASFSGSGGSMSTPWDGSYSGGVIPDGTYSALMTATAADGTVVTKSNTVTVDTVVPNVTNFSVSPTPFTPNGDGVNDSTFFTFDLNDYALVTIQIFDSAGILIEEPLRKFFDAGSFSFEWGGKGQSGATLNAGDYTYFVFVRDSAYNRNAKFPISGSVTIQ